MDCHLQLITAAAKSAAPLLITSRKKRGALSLDGSRQEVGQQHIPVPGKAEHILVCISSSVASRWREGGHLLTSSLVRPLVQVFVQLWALQHGRH